ncbi:MAG: hypothetical protein AAGI28_03610 [Pseudomonadota bacterium]
MLVASAIGYFALWEPTATLQQQIELQASEAAKEYQDGAYISLECEARAIADASKPECLSAKAEAAKEAERNERDLEAQRTMAVWTQAMGKAAVIGTGVGILGLFLIFVTFWETRKAAHAGREANDIARENSHRQLRAYLGVTSVKVVSRTLIYVKIKNFGQTPATNVQMETRHEVKESGDLHSVFHPFGMIDPGVEVSGIIASDNSTLSLPSRACNLRVFISIDYDDQMGGKWTREACFYLPIWLAKKMPWQLHVQPNTTKERERPTNNDERN